MTLGELLAGLPGPEPGAADDNVSWLRARREQGYRAVSATYAASAMGGGPLVSKIGHFRVRLCPGGTRFARLVSGLTITPAPASSAVRTRFSWVLFWSMANIGANIR